MIEIPKQIKIIGKEVDVVISEKVNDDECTFGEWVGLENKLYLKKDVKFLGEILLHEIVECINDRCNLKINHSIMSVLTETLYQVIKDNKLGNLLEI